MLKGPARVWFIRLMPNSINTFKKLSVQFVLHFIRGHKYKKSTACLISIKQREDEMLRSYITHFNKEALSIDEANDRILVAVFTNGLWKGKFLFSLYKNYLRPCQMSYWPERRNPRRGKGKNMHNRTGDGRGPELEIEGRIGAPNPPLEGSQTSPR